MCGVTVSLVSLPSHKHSIKRCSDVSSIYGRRFIETSALDIWQWCTCFSLFPINSSRCFYCSIYFDVTRPHTVQLYTHDFMNYHDLMYLDRFAISLSEANMGNFCDERTIRVPTTRDVSNISVEYFPGACGCVPSGLFMWHKVLRVHSFCFW